MTKTIEERVASLELRVKLVESFLGHTHAPSPEDDAGFQEYPKQVGDKVVYSAEEEKAAGGSGSASAGASASAGPAGSKPSGGPSSAPIGP
jgi:hypothetical protein